MAASLAVSITLAIGHAAHSVPAVTTPPVFRDIPITEAREAAEAADRLVIIDATATWCGPCKVMDATTWIDPDVVAWINDHAIAVQLDVDEQKDAARAWNIRAMPTVIILKDGDEFDRRIGYLDSARMLRWLEAVEQGKTFDDTVRDNAGPRADHTGAVDLNLRQQVAKELLENEIWMAASDEYQWLWDNLEDHEPELAPFRLARMVPDLKTLVANHEPARINFKYRRDKIGEALAEGRGSFDGLERWLILNEVLGDHEASLAWINRIKDRPNAHQTTQRVWHRIDSLLRVHGTPVDYGALIPAPVATARAQIEAWKAITAVPLPKEIAEEHRAAMRQQQRADLVGQLSFLHAALLLAGRQKEADQTAQDLIGAMPGCEAALGIVAAAVEHSVADARHIEILDTCGEAWRTADLRRQIAETLRRR